MPHLSRTVSAYRMINPTVRRSVRANMCLFIIGHAFVALLSPQHCEASRETIEWPSAVTHTSEIHVHATVQSIARE